MRLSELSRQYRGYDNFGNGVGANRRIVRQCAIISTELSPPFLEQRVTSVLRLFHCSKAYLDNAFSAPNAFGLNFFLCFITP